MPHASPQLLVVAHTHWDREWYHTAARFRQRLVPLVDDLLDDPPATTTSFLLDGQAVLLDDYLAVRPERAAELSALLRAGRLEAGPWYVLPDELIPSGEALVRNLLEGRDTVGRLRGIPPDVLYCPDAFGHPATLPELALGFGCPLVVVWRGYGGARWPAGDTARWRGPSGTTVVLSHLPPDGYEFGSTLPVTADAAAARWTRLAEVLLPRETTGVSLLLNGADHHARQHDQRSAVQALAEAAHPVAVHGVSLRAAAAAIVAAAAARDVPEVTGELRDSYGYTWTLGGTLASRAAQKRRNARAERALVRDVEPWIALAGGGTAATRALLRAAWRELLLVHPHDTLCGTSIDAVARSADERLASVEAQADGLRVDALARLAAHDPDAARRARPDWRPALVLRNPVARPRAGVAGVRVGLHVADVAVGPGSGPKQGALTAPDVDALHARGLQILARSRTIALTESSRDYPAADVVEDVDALLWVDAMPGYAIETFDVATLGSAQPRDAVRVGESTLENSALTVSVRVDGMVTVTDRVSRRTVERAIELECHRDVGDLYTPALRERLAGLRFAGCEAGVRGPLRGELRMTFRDDGDGSMLTLSLQLDAGLCALRVVVAGTNASRDMRLRVILRGDVDTPAATLADAAFHPVSRTLLAISDVDAAMEHVTPAAPLHRFVSRYGSRYGMTVISDGLAEYESLADGAIAVTLMRAVGALSRSDLPERPGHAGWPADTPDAQSFGPYRAELALALHGPDTPAQRDVVERVAEDVLLPITGVTLRSNLHAPQLVRGIELDGLGLAFSAAMPARRAGWIVLRCVNRRAARVTGHWRLGISVADACIARLDETPGAALAAHDGVIEFTAEPMEIVTVLARVTAPA